MFKRSIFHVFFSLFLVFNGTKIYAQLSDPISNSSLAGLSAFKVSVSEISSDAQRDGLKTEQLKTDIELKLRDAMIPVITRPVWIEVMGGAQLYFDISLVKYGGTQYSYHIQLNVIQKVSLSRQTPVEGIGITWSKSVMGITGMKTIVNKVPEQVKSEVDSFIESYLSANASE